MVERARPSPVSKGPARPPREVKEFVRAAFKLPEDPKKIKVEQIRSLLRRLEIVFSKKHEDKPHFPKLPGSPTIDPKTKPGRRNLFRLFERKEHQVLIDIAAKELPEDNVAVLLLRSIREATARIFKHRKLKNAKGK